MYFKIKQATSIYVPTLLIKQRTKSCIYMEVVIPALVSSLAAPNTWWVQLRMKLSLHKDDICTYDYKYSSRNLYTENNSE